jgi:dihydrofolate reductase
MTMTNSTRRITMFNQVTADGYFSALDGGLEWATPDEEQLAAAQGGMTEVDTILFGRRTYEQFASFWPQAAEGAVPGGDAHGWDPSKGLRDLAIWFRETTKLVFSRTLEKPSWKNTRVIRELEPHEVEAMKRKPGKSMILFGSASIVSELTRHGLIDDYQILVSPILLGAGRPFLRDVPKSTMLNLVEAIPHRSGKVMLRYARAG